MFLNLYQLKPISAIPNITLKKSADKAKVIKGGTITYTITYTNVGSSTATDVTIIEVLPEKTKLIGIRDSGFGIGIIMVGRRNLAIRQQR